MNEWEKYSELIVAFSGGKDSTACLLWALETGKTVRAVFADTGNEPPETPGHIARLEKLLNITIERYARPFHNFFTMVRKRGQWPMIMRCNVSKANKVNDFRYYLKHTNTPGDAIIILGQRRSESRRRYELPYYSDFIDSGRAAYRPILDWSSEDVFNYLGSKNIPAHPAYGKGRSRVGCIWCVNSSMKNLILDNKLYPKRCAELRALRKEIGLTSIPKGIAQLDLFENQAACLYEAVHCE